MADLSVIILTRDEEIHLARAIASVRPLAREVIVVDSHSTDATVEIAERMGARVLRHPFVSHARQFQWALDNAAPAGAWVMRLDADEVVSPELAAELEALLPSLPERVAGVNLRREHVFLGRRLHHGGVSPLILLRVWRRGRARVEDRWMDEHILLTGGKAVTARARFADHNLKGLAFFTEKHNGYATREAVEVVGRRIGLFPPSERLASRQARIKRWLKDRLYALLPFPLNVFLYAFYRLVLRLGVLDGVEGIAYHCLQGFWYRVLVGARVLELERAVAGLTEPGEIRAALAGASGLPLGEEGTP